MFVGAVNYSISPKENGNIFEGEYSWYDERGRYHDAEDILKVLQEHKFYLVHEQGKLASKYASLACKCCYFV